MLEPFSGDEYTMTTLERYAVTIATSADQPKKARAASNGDPAKFTGEQVIRQRELLAKAAAKRETTDNIGRAIG